MTVQGPSGGRTGGWGPRPGEAREAREAPRSGRVEGSTALAPSERRVFRAAEGAARSAEAALRSRATGAAAVRLEGLAPTAPRARAESPPEGRLVAPGVRLLPLTGPERVRPTRSPYEGLSGAALVAAIRREAEDKRALGYRPAREALFGVVDNRDGVVEGIYTGAKLRTKGIPSAEGPEGMNTEHAWPQSKGTRRGSARSDLHHLFPEQTYANARRGSHPFGEVLQGIRWEQGGSRLGRDAHGQVVFEPRDARKGDIARALFYVSAVYGLAIPEKQEAILRSWHQADPPNADEVARNARIANVQGNRNPFVDHPSLVARVHRFDGR